MRKHFLTICVRGICRRNVCSCGEKYDGKYKSKLEHRGQKTRYNYGRSLSLPDLHPKTRRFILTIDLGDQCTQTLDWGNYEQMKDENEKLAREITALKYELQEKDRLLHVVYMEYTHEKERFLRENKILNEKVIKLTNELEELKVEHRETLMELGEMSVVRTAEINKTSEAEIFQTIFHSKLPVSTMENCEPNSFPSRQMSGSDQDINQTHTNSSEMKDVLDCFPSTSQAKPTSSAREPGFNARDTNDQTKCCENQNQSNTSSHVKTSSPLMPTDETTSCSAENLSFPIQVNQLGEKECINLTDEPTSSITANVRNTYKFLLLTAAYSLLASNIVKLKEWASEKFSIEPNASEIEIIFELDKKGVINAFDLSELRAFFESIVRHDLVFLIDEFCAGDYTSLRMLIHSGYKRRTGRGATYAHTRLYDQRVHVAADTVSSHPLFRVTSNGGNTRVLERKSTIKVNTTTSNVGHERCRESLNRNHSRASNPSAGFTGAVASRKPDVVADGHEINNTRVTQGYTSPRREAISNDIPTTSGESNGAKMSKQSRSSSQTSKTQKSNLVQKSSSGSIQSQGNGNLNGSGQDIGQKEIWLCSHYKRRCYVKFDCCRKFWACHRCHNNQRSCGRKKLKSRDTTMIKCVECGTEQQFGHYCVQCNIKFAEFYCGLCKHLTGMDDYPYHCDKCGICRIHGDRSFHCDVCGVCLDVQLRGNHKCRPDSAHDGCCICLEDAFTGCQILPCSHKVHKVCATQMIRKGITRCPVCRESFAHKLERKSGKKR